MKLFFRKLNNIFWALGICSASLYGQFPTFSQDDPSAIAYPVGEYPPPPPPYTGLPSSHSTGSLSPAFTYANARAMHFINLIDVQAYGGAWADASKLMQDVVPRQIWVEGVKSLRTGMGVVKSRVIVSHQALSSLPSGVRGTFMTINFSVDFANNPNVVESVTMMVEGPIGLWRVVSYRIGPQ